MGAPGDPGGGGRPHVVVNCAITADGKLALGDRTPLEISSEDDMLRVHRLRASCDAILVGAGTVLADDPKLHVSAQRVPDPPTPLKVVLDSSDCTPAEARFMSSPGRALVATVEPLASGMRERLGGRAEVLAFGTGPRVDLPSLLGHLHMTGVRRLMVEGGGETIWSFLSEGLVDELSVYVGPMVAGGRDAPTMADGEGALGPDDVVRLELLSVDGLGEGLWIRYRVTGHR